MDPDYFKSYDMCWGTLGTVRPFNNFHPGRDVQEIQAALEIKDAGTLVRILSNRSNAQRQEVVRTFREMTQKALIASLNGKKADVGPWINILTSRDTDHLNTVFMGLELETGQVVEELVEKRFSGDVQQGLKVLVECIESPHAYLAKRIATMKPSIVQGLMVSHSEEDLLCIRTAFLKLTGTSLYTALQKQFKGDHLQALLAICRSED
ncbi:annexin A2-like [Hippoglossus hippoglossus]|uniref:annexin A2-like n=1 Tax=Hippoglossus hippoglossus TaxID=8267 RepID=UPI00148CE2F2|nr:annexin A2-like [Hippoglossus hippoglossus]